MLACWLLSLGLGAVLTGLVGRINVCLLGRRERGKEGEGVEGRGGEIAAGHAAGQ